MFYSLTALSSSSFYTYVFVYMYVVREDGRGQGMIGGVRE